MNDSSYVTTCVDTSQNQNYLWTMATDGNFANYAKSSTYLTLNESEARLGRPYGMQCNKPAIFYSNPSGYQCTRNAIYYNSPITSKKATQYMNLNKTAQRYSNYNGCGSNSSCSISDEYNSMQAPMTRSDYYAVGPYNQFGWEFVNTAPRYNVEYTKNSVAPYENVCINGGMSCYNY
jgi:hypothetical protein